MTRIVRRELSRTASVINYEEIDRDAADAVVRTYSEPLPTAEELARQAASRNIRTITASLRAWKVDADTAVAAWDGRTTAQNVAVLKTVTNRFGVLADNLADLLTHLAVDK